MTSRAIAAGSSLLALAASIFLLVVPTYSGLSATTSSSGGPTRVVSTSQTLLAVNGSRVLLLLLFPVAVSAIGILPSRHAPVARRIRATLGFFLLAFVLFTGFSIGFLYAPAAGVMMLAAGRTDDATS